MSQMGSLLAKVALFPVFFLFFEGGNRVADSARICVQTEEAPPMSLALQNKPQHGSLTKEH